MNESKKRDRIKGITLIALVITVIVMLIIAGVAISAISTGGIPFGKIQNVAGEYSNVSQNEAEEVNKLVDMIDGDYETPSTEIIREANEPKLVEGMKAVVFNTDGTTKQPASSEEWYNYENKQWANAETEDGSLWVWIPRFAYKITYYTDETKTTIKGTRDVEGYKNASGEIVTNTGTEAESGLDTIGSEVKSNYGSIEVVFLQDDGNQYYKNIDGSLALVNAVDDGYIIHPAFKDGRGNYANGEWNKELTGFWIAKFQAGFQYGDASLDETQKDGKEVARSSIKYTQEEVYISQIESGTSSVITLATARNYIDGEYGSNFPNISYPVFKGNNYAMNYITIGECYSLSRVLNETNNPYGFNTVDSDTHLTKNSEWGATVYLSYSNYGLNGDNPHINNKTLDNSVQTIHAVTGYAAENEHDGTSYLWYTDVGQSGSSNGNIAGVYDMSGATWERVSAYVANGNVAYGSSFAVSYISNNPEENSTEYATLYKHNEEYDNISIAQTGNNSRIACRNNYKLNYLNYGDAVYEISTTGEYKSRTSFNETYSTFASLKDPFIARGGCFNDGTRDGMTVFNYSDGGSICYDGFRAVVCPL